jgi:hypothetical protein
VIIQPTSVAALTWLGAAAGASSEGWRIGSVLSARPLGISEQGLMVLQVGALTVEAEAPGTKLPPQFQVRVLSLGAQPQLEILGAGSQLDGNVNQALRERLPQQNGYAPLLATMGALSQWSIVRQLPPYLRSALALLEHSMSTPQEVSTGEGLRQAVNRSGIFLEAQLAQAPASDATTERRVTALGCHLERSASGWRKQRRRSGSTTALPRRIASRTFSAPPGTGQQQRSDRFSAASLYRRASRTSSP